MRGWWEQDNLQLKIDELELDNSKLIACALKLKISIFSALELDHFILWICAQELENSRWGALKLNYSKYRK